MLKKKKTNNQMVKIISTEVALEDNSIFYLKIYSEN